MSEWAKAKDQVGSDHLAQAHVTAPNADVVVVLFHRAFLGHDRLASHTAFHNRFLRSSSISITLPTMCRLSPWS
jgi:hypothetical protein